MITVSTLRIWKQAEIFAMLGTQYLHAVPNEPPNRRKNTVTTNYAEKYGIAPTNQPLDTLARLFAAFDGAMTLQDDLEDSDSSGKTEKRNEIKKNEQANRFAEACADMVRANVFHTLEDSPESATQLIEHLRFLIDQIEDVEACVFAEMDRSSKKPTVTSAELVEAREVSEWAKENVTKMFTLLPMFGVDITKDAPWFPTKTNKQGEVVPNLRNLKSGPRENAGRDAAIKRYRYTINDQEIPSGISMHEVAVKYCSTLTDRINGKELKTKIEKVNEGKSFAETEKFSVEVPAGILHAEIVAAQ